MYLSGRRLVLVAASFLLLSAIVISTLLAHNAMASTPLNDLTSRSLTLSSSSPAAASATTTYTFTFTVPTTGTAIKSVGIQICTTADVDTGGTCTAPTGFSNASAALASQPTGLGAATGWTIDGSEPAVNDLYISNSSNATNPSGAQTIVFSNVQNPTTANQTFFGRITTYSDAAWTTIIDAGTVAASTANPIVLTGTMPESLIFCTGATVGVTNSIPDCTTATSGSITFPMLFSPTSTAYTTSQMAASTNALSGYAISVLGATLTSGTNTITAIGATPAASTVGTGQFGMNLAANTGAQTGDPNITGSAYVSPSPNGTNLMGKAKANFDIGDPKDGGGTQSSQFAFAPGVSNLVAASDNGTGTGAPTDSQIFTSSYIVNVAGHQPAGTYTTTLTYICTPTF